MADDGIHFYGKSRRAGFHGPCGFVTDTHIHTYSEETEESLFYFSVVFFYILLGSKIGGFQHGIDRSRISFERRIIKAVSRHRI